MLFFVCLLFILFYWGWGVQIMASWQACGSHRSTFGSQFSPLTLGSRDWTQVVRLVWQRFWPSEPPHWPQLHLKKRIQVWGTDALYVVKAAPGCILVLEWGEHRVSLMSCKPPSSGLLCPRLLCSGVGLFGFLLPPQHTLARPVLRILFRLIWLHLLQQHWSQKPIHITLQSPSRATHAWALTQAMASVS